VDVLKELPGEIELWAASTMHLIEKRLRCPMILVYAVSKLRIQVLTVILGTHYGGAQQGSSEERQ
jgi:hypothetical protein